MYLIRCDYVGNILKAFITSHIVFFYKSHETESKTDSGRCNKVDLNRDHMPVESYSLLSATEDVISIVTEEDIRSRRARYFYEKRLQMSVYRVKIINEVKRHLYRSREREPSRIPTKKLGRLMRKSKMLRKLVRKHIRRNVPRSSRIFRLLYASSRERLRMLNDQVRYVATPTGRRKQCLRCFKNTRKHKLCNTRKAKQNHVATRSNT